ncbi:phosphoesterase family-domain-containing protein [Penicillium canariense]|uniref:Phosphoesterase family-domain-containing protein n=1 Tax=Penicillium canariense TaxID=189055 RepID=A0A9W9I3N5_9EURO|nr:phosphoesterase family-domain-containing protein [Penicillium canariense]KAJ5167325.1 phosphoesterase family-domain-containing protein [Penicillium canariense]
MVLLLGAVLAVLLGSSPVAAGSLRDIEHVVIFMQENRAWDTYFGTMAGVRGFNDPNVQVNADGQSVWNQQVDPDMSTATNTLLPWYLGYKGGDWNDAIQCMAAGDNGYQDNQAALNHGLNNHWARNNTPWSWGYYKREDIPVQFAIAEGWTSGDMYQESQITSTNPNRVTLVSGSVNVPGSPQNSSQGGVYIDNNEVPGCDSQGINCYPLKWKTVYEFYEDAGVSWQLYQDTNNFDDNPLAWFSQFQKASKNSPLAQKGMSFVGLDAFYAAAANGSLPEVSFIVGPAELSEHPPYQPKDGGWLQKQVVEAVINSPKYSSTLLMISFDETGGFGDHVTPFHSPQGTPGEWMEDPMGLFGDVFVGPGFRVPFYMISPWTRGNRVFTERADHNSQILFVEQWLTARGYNGIQTDQMVPWRRLHMSNLVNALDLENPDLSLPSLPEAETPVTNGNGDYVGSAQCQAKHPTQRPPVPYGHQDDSTNALWFEDGYKEVVGYLTEGRYLVAEKGGSALTNSGKRDYVTVTPATKNHESKSQRWIIHYTEDQESEIFTISSALDGRWLGARGVLLDSDQAQDAEPVRITFLGNGLGYTVQYVNGNQYVDVDHLGSLQIATQDQSPDQGFKLYSVTYHE